MQVADFLLIEADQLVTCASGGKAKRRGGMRDLHIIQDGAIAIRDGVIIDIGTTSDVRTLFRSKQVFSARGRAVIPGFVDCHTHIAYGGNRIDEFEEKISGTPYLDILARGGGINSTVRHTREASHADLFRHSADRLDEMLHAGTTTVEAKTGYGLDTATEIKLLEVLDQLQLAQSVDIVPTFLGAHAIPPEYATAPHEYAHHVASAMLPAWLDAWHSSSFARKNPRTLPFIDVFTERNAFDVEQSRLVLEAGKAAGMPIKAHIDEFNALGGLELALELGAQSVDHLDVTSPEKLELLAKTDTVGVMLPVVNFHLGSTHFADGRALIDAGGILALATDANPGSAPCFTIPFVMALACRYLRLTPAEALNAVTINAAAALGMEDRIGSLEVGKKADMLMLRSADYRSLVYEIGGNPVETIIKNGEIIL